MEDESFHSEKSHAGKDKPYLGVSSEWAAVMDTPEEDIKFDYDCPPLESGVYINPVRHFNGRVIEPRKSSTAPIDADILAFIQSRVPQVQMTHGIPVFMGTLVPIKRMFDFLLAGKTLDEFLHEFPAVSRDAATSILRNDATLFYEGIG